MFCCTNRHATGKTPSRCNFNLEKSPFYSALAKEAVSSTELPAIALPFVKEINHLIPNL